MHATRYPIGLLIDETRLAVDRINNRIATEAVLVNLAVSSVLSKKSGAHFKKTLAKLRGEVSDGPPRR